MCLPRDLKYEYSTNNEKNIRIRIRSAKFLRMRIFVSNIRNECEFIRYSCRPLAPALHHNGGLMLCRLKVLQALICSRNPRIFGKTISICISLGLTLFLQGSPSAEVNHPKFPWSHMSHLQTQSLFTGWISGSMQCNASYPRAAASITVEPRWSLLYLWTPSIHWIDPRWTKDFFILACVVKVPRVVFLLITG